MLHKSHAEIAGNELEGLFAFFLSKYSSLVQIVCSIASITCMQLLKFLLVYANQKICSLSATELCGGDYEICADYFIQLDDCIGIWKSLLNDVLPIWHKKYFWEKFQDCLN